MLKVLTIIAVGLCSLTTAAGVLGIVSPARLADLIILIQEPTGLYIAAGSRLLFGGTLLGVAAGSRAPTTLTVIGWILIFSGIMMSLVGVEYIAQRVGWSLALGPWFLRVWGGVAILFGGSLIYAMVSRAPDHGVEIAPS